MGRWEEKDLGGKQKRGRGGVFVFVCLATCPPKGPINLVQS